MSEKDDAASDMTQLQETLREVQSLLEATQTELTEARNAQESLASEGERLRKQAMTFEARRTKEAQAHEAALARLRKQADSDVIHAELRAEATRLGAHNPDDVLRLLDLSNLRRNEDGTVEGVGAALEQARAERSYLFSAAPVSGAVSGNTVGSAAPRPGHAPGFDARGAPAADYETRKWQFLKGNS